MATKSNRIHIHHNVKDMKTLIYSCDLVVSAAGSTMYELSDCGVPLITYSMADNQIPGTEAFEKLGLAMSCGDLREKTGYTPAVVNTDNGSVKLVDNVVVLVLDKVERLANDFLLRKKMVAKMQQLIDGKGADRLVKELLY